MENRPTTNYTFLGIPVAYQRPAKLKFAILAKGLRLTKSANDFIYGTGEGTSLKKPIRTRSGVSGGLDLRLPQDIFVNAPIHEPFAYSSEILLEATDSSLFISENGEKVCTVDALPEPGFYARQTHDGSEWMVRIGQMCSPDRLCYGMTGPGCSFWPANERCRYCSIGLNAPADASHKREEHLYEVIGAALAEAQWPARHVLLGGGTPQGSDMGALLAARLCKGIKQRFDISVYVMIAAPLENHYIDVIYDAGVDELGLNLEFWNDTAWDLYIPGKKERIGKRRYLEALEYTAARFGPVRARSILIVGLEDAVNTLAAVTALVNMGVMPILSPFRPLAGTALEKEKGFDADAYIDLYEKAKDISENAGLPLGPTCICCQNNTLTLPFGPQYRWY